MADYRVKVQEILTQLNQVILGKEIFIKNILEALLADGHILLEDLPGVGKTTMALAFSKVLGLDWNRVQFTPDVMSSDLCGFSIYRKEKETFEYCPGAVFCNLLLADEINRTSPKTQSALLEAMEEKQVTVDGTTYRLPQPFFVIATQNPLDSVGTQRLPAAQMDRFLICLQMGYPDFLSEVQLAKELSLEKRTQSLTPLADAGLLLAMQQEVDQIYIQDTIYEYLVQLIRKTRDVSAISCGASPRATLALVKMAKASAWMQGRDYVIPQDVSSHLQQVLIHRLTLSARAVAGHKTKADIIQEILDMIPVPSLGR